MSSPCKHNLPLVDCDPCSVEQLQAELTRRRARIDRATPFAKKVEAASEVHVVAPKNALVTWSFHEAPEAFRALSPHGGDEDWLTWAPPGFPHYISWIDEGTPYGCCSVSEAELADGARIYIGAHA